MASINLLGKTFEHYGRFVAVHPYPFIVVPVLMTLLLSSGALFIRVEDDIRFLYSPINSKAREEYKIHQSFSGEDILGTYLGIAIQSNDGSTNLLTKEKTKYMRKLEGFMRLNLTLNLGGRELKFGEEVCPANKQCPDSNAVFNKFLVVYWDPKLNEASIKYPVMTLLDSRFFLPGHIYGVKTDNDSRILSVAMAHLIYPLPKFRYFSQKTNKTLYFSAEDISAQMEKSLKEFLANETELSEKLRVSYFSQHNIRHELAKNTWITLPFLPLTVCLLVVFTVASSMTGNMVRSKPVEALCGVTSSGMAIISAAGLMFFLGQPFITQVIVMPFIALAIGVDDTYIILGAWQTTDPTLSPRKRLGLTLKEAGAAITVTSITDCLSFGIGSFSQTPAISIFCQFVAAGIFFDFLYQITFFAAAVALGGNREAKGDHCLKFWKLTSKPMPKTESKMPLSLTDLRYFPDSGSVPTTLDSDSDSASSVEEVIFYSNPIQKFFGTHFARILISPFSMSLILLISIAFLVMSIIGTSQMVANLTPLNYLVDTSPAGNYIALAQKYVWSEGLTGRIYVSNPPDFRLGKEEVDKFLGFVSALEATDYSVGEKSTALWLRAFFHGFWEYFGETDYSKFYDKLEIFLGLELNRQWRNYIRWYNYTTPQGDKKRMIRDFFFTSAFQIKNFKHRAALLTSWRGVTGKYANYSAVVYDENNFYSDQVLALPETAMQAMGVSLVFMTGICAVFIMDFSVVFWVVLSLFSMDIGTIGILSFWGSDLSPTTIVNILMSIGLSVDFATHVGYRFSRDKSNDVHQKIAETLGSIAWPVLQGGISTLLAVAGLYFVGSHVVRVFFRTIILVVTLGVFHGLFLLPVILKSVTKSKRS